jgi:hypothetical protein
VKLGKKSDKLPTTNRKDLDEVVKSFGSNQVFTPLLQLMADVCDSAANGSDCYITLGASRDKQSLLMTITQDGAKAYLSEFTLRGLSAAAETLL